MPPALSNKVRCRLCQAILPGWLPIPNVPDGALLLNQALYQQLRHEPQSSCNLLLNKELWHHYAWV
jgi:hypothetical protein